MSGSPVAGSGSGPPAGGSGPPPLDAIEVVRVRLPLRRAHRAAHGTESVRDVVLVRVLDVDGVEGWGECSALSVPGYTHEHTASAWAVLTGGLAPAVLAGGPVDRVSHPMAWAALSAAVADLDLRRTHRPWTGLLVPGPGAELRRAVPRTAVVGRQVDEAATVAAVEERLETSPALVKLKIEPGWDRAPLAAVRAALGDVALAADANGAYDPDVPGDRAALAGLGDLGLVFLEQPFAPGAWASGAAAARDLPMPVAVDESVVGPGTARRAARLGAGAVNVKPARLGGWEVALAVLAELERSGPERPRAFVGGMLETGVGRVLAARLAALPGLDLPTDLGPSDAYLVEDVTEPVVLDGAGRLVVPYGPGLCGAPRPERLARVAVARHLVRAPARAGRPAVPGPVTIPAPAVAAAGEAAPAVPDPALVDAVRLGPAGQGWEVVRWRGGAAALHGLELPVPVARTAWALEPTGPALVWGSTQAPSDPGTGDGVERARRRSGGGLVELRPGATLWVDLVVPRDDPLWDDDVERSFHWLGELWATALSTLGLADLAVHRGPADRSVAARAVCFAGLGPGEVTVGGRKVVGLSQRRTRTGARFQCVTYCGAAVPLGVLDDLGAGADLRPEVAHRLRTATAAVPGPPARVLDALLASLP